MPTERNLATEPDPFAPAYAHLRRAHAADAESRESGERRALFFREPDPADFLGVNEDGSLSYRPRGHDAAHIALDEGLAALHGLLERWAAGKVSPPEGRQAAARLRDWVAEAEAEAWAEHDPADWPQVALALREIRGAAAALANG